MRIARAFLLLLVFLFPPAAGAEVLRVVRLDLLDSAVFRCGDRCKFRGPLPNEPLRVRIIRGTVAELAAMANNRRYAAAGCIELYSTVIRPRRSRRTADLLDLKFYFSTRWLASPNANGEYVFIVERDTTPDGPDIERTSMLRLPTGAPGAAYFRAGIDVAVRAPTNTRKSGGGLLAILFGSASKAAATMTTMSAMDDSPEAPVAGADDVALPLTEAMPRATASANCVDVLIDPAPVSFRRADAAAKTRPTRIAAK